MPYKLDKKDINNGKKVNKPPKKGFENKRPIDLLFGSRTRVDVLWCLMKYKGLGLLVSEIARDTGHNHKDVQRALDILNHDTLNLAWKGIRTSDGSLAEIAGSRRYGLNNDHLWKPGLRLILETVFDPTWVIQDHIASMFGVDVAFVYGSIAKQKHTPESDIDLVIIGYRDRNSFYKPFSVLEERIGRDIDWHHYSPAEWRDAYVNKEHFVRSIMSEPKIFLKGDENALELITAGEVSGPDLSDI